MAFGGCRYRLGGGRLVTNGCVSPCSGLQAFRPGGYFSVVAAFAVPPHLAWGRICIVVARGETHGQPKT